MGIGTGHSIADGDITGQELLISELPVQPGMSADELQERFDALGLFIKGKYNALVADLENAFTAAGITNGVLTLPPAGQEPTPANGPNATTVAGQLNYLLWVAEQINIASTAVTIGDGTVTDAKLSNTATEIKKRVTDHLGGVTKHTVGHLPTGTTSTTVALGNHTHSGFAATSHDHDASDIGTGTLAFGRLPTGTTGTTVAKGDHVHDGAAINTGKVPFARLPTGTTTSTVALGSHTHAGTDVSTGTLADARIPTLAISKISGLQVSLDLKASAFHDHDGTYQPAGSYAPASHPHAISNVTNLQASLDDKQATITGSATTITSSTLTGLRALITNETGKVAVSSVTSGELYQLNGIDTDKNIQAQLDSKSAYDHKHSGADITSGTVPVARLPIIYSSTMPTYAAGNVWLKPV